MSKNVGKRVFKQTLVVNNRIFKENLNTDLKLRVPNEEKNTPHTIIPKSLYEDFNRSSYKVHKLTFPIKVPLKLRRIDATGEHLRYAPEHSRGINFNEHTGNEILLSLRRFTEYDLEELVNLFMAMSHKPTAKSLQLESHPFVQPALRHLTARLEALTVKNLMHFALSIERLGFEDAEAWKKVRTLLYDKVFAFESLGSGLFAEAFRIFFTRYDELLDSEREMLLDQLPRYVHKLRAQSVANLFGLLVDHKVITSPKDYLFAKHFFIIFWKKAKIFEVAHFSKIIAGMRKIGFLQNESKFLLESFLPAIMSHLHECESPEEINKLIGEVEELESIGVPLEPLTRILDALRHRLLFTEQLLGRVKRSEFIEVVKSDIAQYKEKRRRLAELIAKRKGEAQSLVNPFVGAQTLV